MNKWEMGMKLTIHQNEANVNFETKSAAPTRFWVLMHASSLKWYAFNLVGSCVEIYRLVPVVPTVIVSGNRVDIMAHGSSEINHTITEKQAATTTTTTTAPTTKVEDTTPLHTAGV